MTKILLSTYSAATHTSFGRITRDLWTALLQTGQYRIAQHAWFHQKTIEGLEVPFEIYPTNAGFDPEGRPMLQEGDRYGAQSFGRLVHQMRPDIVWSLADAYMIEHLAEWRRTMGFKLALWIPIDGEPIPSVYKDTLQQCDLLVGVTKWGSKAMQSLTGGSAETVYHGVDPEVFKPLSDDQRENLRKHALGSRYSKDAIVMGFVGKNQFRKMPWIIYPIQYYLRSGNWMYKADGGVELGHYDRNARKGYAPQGNTSGDWIHPKAMPNMRFWVHSFAQEGGINFPYQEELWGQKGEVIYTQGLGHTKGFDDGAMNDVYNLFDMYVSMSGGEGFGMPLIEAAAAGVPVIYSDYSGQGEVGKQIGGIAVPEAARITEHGSGIERVIPDIAQCVLHCYLLAQNKEMRKSMGRAGRRSVVENFDYTIIAAQWKKLLDDLAAQEGRSAFGVRL